MSRADLVLRYIALGAKLIAAIIIFYNYNQMLNRTDIYLTKKAFKIINKQANAHNP